MKTLILLITLVTATMLRAQTSTLVAVEENGSRSTRVNMVFLPDGYTSGQMGKFATDVQAALNFLLSKEPWNRYRSYLNIYRIEVASNQSGTDYTHTPDPKLPRTTPIVLKDTYFHTGFVTNGQGFDRLNTISSAGSSRAYAVLNKHVPEYDIPIVIVNDSTYGGSGGPIAVFTTEQNSAAIFEHELGHSFAKLTDEYDEDLFGYPETEFPNATKKTERSEIRWNVWINANTPLPTQEISSSYFDPGNTLVGIYEGANYRAKGWYRPHDNALMRRLQMPPGSITREAIVLNYYSRVSPMDDYAPKTLSRTVTSQLPLTFSVTPKVPSTGPSLTVQWLLDNVPISGQTSSTLNIASKDIGNGAHKIKAIVKDPTDWVRRDPSALTSDEITWSLTLSNQVGTAVITTQLPPMTVLQEGSSLQLNAISTGPGPITYRWFKGNVELSPPVTTPTLTLGPVSLADAGTYTVRVTNPAATVSHSSVLGVIKTTIPRVVVGRGGTATLPIIASKNVTSAFWSLNGGPTISNNARYAGATTKSLQIRKVDTSDSGSYSFGSGAFTGGQAQLLVVTGKTDYTGQSVSLPVGIIGAAYNQPFPGPNNPLLTANSYSALKLPKGLVIHSKTGLITGIPTVASVDQTLGDEVSFTVGNEFGKTTIKVRLLIKPLPPGVEGSFAGPVYVNSALGSTTGGLMSLTVNSTGSFTGSALIGTETLSFKGIVRTVTPTDTTASGSIVLKPKHLTSPLSRTFIINNSLDSDPTTASLTDDYTNFQLWRNKWAAPGSVNPYAGYHTFYLTSSPNANAPKGHGFGSVSIGTTGRTTATGRLADGSSFSTTSFLTAEGSVFVYQTLYTTVAKGSFIAFLDLDDGSPDFFNTGKSISNWFRPADPRPITATVGRSYRNGFGLGVNPETPLPIGGLYVPPAKTAIPMELSTATNSPPRNAELSFQHLLGNDPLAVVPDVTLDLKPGSSVKVNAPNNKATTFSINPADGRFKGSYTTLDPDPRPPLAPSTRPRTAIKRKIDYQGIIVRENGIQKGYGFFLRDALPLADGSTTPTTSPRDSGSLELKKTP